MVNVCGLPAVSVPVTVPGDVPGGLPAGIQLIGKPGSELLLLQLAAQLEQQRGTPVLPA
jgi:amidase